MLKVKKNKGVGLVEVMIGIAIVVGATLASFVYFSLAIKVARQSAETVQAALLVEEGMEAIRAIRDNGYSTHITVIPTDTNRYLAFSGSEWQATSTPSVIEGIFTRTFTLGEVRRDGSDDIVLSGGTIDPDVVEVRVVVSWEDESGGTKDLEASTYIANIHEE
jgi:Tfp pilus assembly protein PilE